MTATSVPDTLPTVMLFFLRREVWSLLRSSMALFSALSVKPSCGPRMTFSVSGSEVERPSSFFVKTDIP